MGCSKSSSYNEINSTKFFLKKPFFQSLLNFLQILFLFLCFCFFGHKACGILAPQAGTENAPPELEGEVLTTGLPEKSVVLNAVLEKKDLK